MADHIAKMNIKFSTLVAMNDKGSKSMQVAIWVSLISHLPKYAAIKASINTMKENEAGWNCVSITFIQEQEIHISQSRRVKRMDSDVGTLATSFNKNLKKSSKNTSK